MQEKSKIKKDKIYRWKVYLLCYNYNIIYREGKLNIPADTISRIHCSRIKTDKLIQLLLSLCEPEVTRLYAFNKNHNLPFSVDDVELIAKQCTLCCVCLPRYHKPLISNLIKASQPLER